MSRSTRRELLIAGAAGLATWELPAAAQQVRSPNSRPGVGAIGVGGRGSGIARAARAFGDITAVCDVDRAHAEQAAADPRLGAGRAAICEDYRRLLDRADVELVTIGTPDHWHTRICVDALRAGKDVYCEKPLTLTIEEGKLLCRVVYETGRVLQVGTQQRSEMANRFLTAVAMVREGRIGRPRRAVCAIGGAPAGGPFPVEPVPAGLNWDLWLGPAPKVDYRKERCHGNFRWWYEYSGGKMTDWGAHHVDIAHWALGLEHTGPRVVEPISATHPVPFRNGYPTQDDRYNTATAFQVRCEFAGDLEIVIRDDTENGITFEGDAGSFFVSRSTMRGPAVDAMREDPISEARYRSLRKGKPLGSHMANFVECVADRSLPVSDVFSHHRALTTCHLANIAIRLGRTLRWDPETEQILNDPEARAMQAREPRRGFEIA